MRFGILVPHFGAFASRDSVVRLSTLAEDVGFGSLWVRDHLIWKPHGIDGSDRTFLDPFVVLGAIAAVTRRVTLGTSVTIPIRWPLMLAQEYASLSFLSDRRVIAGMGLGFNPDEFLAAGFDAADRESIFAETVDILRLAWSGGPIRYEGSQFQIDGVELFPTPAKPIDIMYGGTTPAGVRRAVKHTDGWLCGRLPLETLDARLRLLREQAGPDRHIHTAVQPLVVIDVDRRAARRRVPIDDIAHSSEGAKFWVKPSSGSFETIEDLAGLVVCGTPDEVVDQVAQFVERGVDELIFDFRLQFDDLEKALELVGSRVLPQLPQFTTS